MSEIGKKTLLVVTPYFPPSGGGLERYAYEISSRLNASGEWRVVVVTSGAYCGDDSVEDMNGICVNRLSYDCKISNTPFSFKWKKKIKQILEQEKPALINIHTPVPGIGDVTAKVAGAIPIIVTYHTGSMHKGRLLPDIGIYIYEHWFMHRLLKRAKKIICSSDFVRFKFLGKYIYKSETITPAVDTEIFKPDPAKVDANPTVLFVAGLNRAEQYKGLQKLLEAVALVKEKIPTVRLLVVGDGDMRAEYEIQTEKLGLRDSVTFTGRLFGDQLAVQYQRARIFALPTSNDSFSMAVLEAMACKLPVVAGNVGGMPTIIEGGINGFLVEPKDVQILANKIVNIFEDEHLANLMGLANIKTIIQKYNWQQRTKAYESILKNSLNNTYLRILQTPVRFTPYIGGVEKYVQDLSSHLSDAGDKVTVICANEPKTGSSVNKNMEIKRLPYIFKISNTNITLTLFAEIMRTKFDILHTHFPTPWVADISMLVAFIKRKPLILTYHNDISGKGLAGLIADLYNKTFLNILLKQAHTIIITQKKYIEHSKYLKPYKSKIKVVPIAVDTSETKLLDAPRDYNSIFFLSSLDKYHRYKALDILIESIGVLKKQGKNVKLFVGGGGELLLEYKELATKLDLSDRVVFLGRISDEMKNQYYQQSAAFILPSNSNEEGFGIVALEAMANKTPVIVTDRVGVADDVKNFETGFVVAENNPIILAEKINCLTNEPQLVEKLGTNGRNMVIKKYTWNNVVNEIRGVYLDSIQ